MSIQEESGEGVSLMKVSLKDESPERFYILDTEAEGGSNKNLFRLVQRHILVSNWSHYVDQANFGSNYSKWQHCWRG